MIIMFGAKRHGHQLPSHLGIVIFVAVDQLCQEIDETMNGKMSASSAYTDLVCLMFILGTYV